MKTSKQTALIISMTLTSFLFFGNAYAEDKTTTTQSHEEHKGSGEGEMMDHGKMGSMNMEGMKGMMQECMQMHKDGKMCDHQTMEKCQEKMGKTECKKMMKKMKSKEK